jgi:hypothetical protein
MIETSTLKYELYCKHCDAPVGYTDHFFEVGAVLNAERYIIVLPNGEKAKSGEKINCKCPGGYAPIYGISQRENPDWCELCGGTGEISTDEQDGEGHTMRGVGTQKCICRVKEPEYDNQER